jgi:ferredoxin, 2Fe-2S
MFMAEIFVTSREGVERRIEVDVGDRPTLMEAIRNDGSFDLIALCGGMLSCSTCHVYVDPGWAERIEPITVDEQDLVGSSEHCAPNSRLSCQIRLDGALDGLRVSIAPED